MARHKLIDVVPCHVDSGQRANVSKKWLAFASLVVVQVSGTVFYKSSSHASKYNYSTFAAMTIAEFCKLTISACLHLATRNSAVRPDKSVMSCANSKVTLSSAVRILALAAMYFVNNQITFLVLLRVDPATFDLLRSSSSLITALVWCLLLNKYVGSLRWAALLQQICGLVVTQFDACSNTTTTPSNTLVIIMGTVVVSSLTAVWNEQQLKCLPVPMHMQNIVLYSGGAVLNFAGHLYMAWTRPGTPGFFAGHNPASIGVILFNIAIGFACVAVYKYADSVMKALAASMTTVLTIVLSWAFYGLTLNPVTASGCVIVVVSVLIYTLTQ
jgi:drug/metabolite transporter (DMT)-like permease